MILLHGLGRTSRSMRRIEARLLRSGYRVHNVDYPSRDGPPESLVPHVAAAVAACCLESPRVHFVTHSLGGLLTRAYIEQSRPPNLGRVVMLAPPNHGSEIVDTMAGNRLFVALFGPAVAELGTTTDSFPNQLGPANFEVGIIAGNRSVNPLGSAMIAGVDDGAVSLASAQLEGMSDFVVIRGNHSFIMRNDTALDEILHFLRYGRFSQSEIFAHRSN